jgi:ketosteroid isomerase-like protein
MLGASGSNKADTPMPDTSAQHKSTLQKANAAIQQRDIEGFLAHCTDDVQWTTVGGESLNGKQALRQWMTKAYRDPPEFTVTGLIAEGDTLVALGQIITENKDGVLTPHAYCDVWRFRDGKMAELRAFVIETAAG